MKRLDCWLEYDGKWVDQTPLRSKATAQILLGANASVLFPYDIMNERMLPVQTAYARLKKSLITEKYLIVGHDGSTTQIYIIPMDGLPTDEENEEDLQDYVRPGEDDVQSDDDEVSRTVLYKPEVNLSDEPFDAWISNINT